MTKIKLILLACFICSMVLSSQARKEEITLIMVPREDPAVQMALDVANRYPSLLISYLVSGNGSVSLHGWTGTQWVNIKPEDFVAGSFFKNGPNSALIIEKDGAPVSDALIPSVDWCSDVAKITTTEIRPLIHLVGQYYNFDFKDWKWFSKRYNQTINAINPEGLNISWYHKQLKEHFEDVEKEGTSDLQYWVSIRQSVVLNDPAFEESEKSLDDENENPLTNAVPAAVILGAGDVPEEHSDEPAPQESTNAVTEASGDM